MHNGVSARVLAHVEVAAPVVNLGRGEMAFLTRDLELGGAVVARDAAPRRRRGGRSSSSRRTT